MSSASAGHADLPLPRGFYVDRNRISYGLLPEDYATLYELSEGRYESYDEIGDPNRRAPDKSGEKVHDIGLRGELAVAKFYDLPLDDRILEGGDDGYDFDVVFDGVPARIDVKVTTYEPPWLQTMSYMTSADYYIGTYVDGSVVQLLGMASREQLLNGEYGKTTGKDHHNYKLEEGELDSLPIPERIVARSESDRDIDLEAEASS